MIEDKKVIFLAAGGTGGHVFPAMSLAVQLRDSGFTVILLTDKRGKKFAKADKFDQILELDSATINLKRPQSWFRSIALLSKGLKDALNYVKAYKPVLIIGFGGYPSLAPLVAGKLKGISLMIHEQNTVMGRANRLLSRWADKIALAFPIDNLKDNKKSVVVGLPIRQDILDILPAPYKMPEADDKFNLLVFGGSQAASFFSEIVPASVALLDQSLLQKLHITQQAKLAELPALQQNYKSLNISYEVAEFFDDIAMKLRDAHFVISRAGASSAFELFLVGRPSILVPYPYALDHDQAGNANAISQGVGFEVIQQAELTKERLAAILATMLENPNKLAQLAAAMQDKQATMSKYAFRDLILSFLKDKSS